MSETDTHSCLFGPGAVNLSVDVHQYPGLLFVPVPEGKTVNILALARAHCRSDRDRLVLCPAILDANRRHPVDRSWTLC